MADRRLGIGTSIAGYWLVIVLLWIGGMKFTAYEAHGIEPLVAHLRRIPLPGQAVPGFVRLPGQSQI